MRTSCEQTDNAFKKRVDEVFAYVDIDYGDDNDICSDFIDGKRNYEQYVKTAGIQPSRFIHNMSILISLIEVTIATCRYERQR